jgi:hypothetical protein
MTLNPIDYQLMLLPARNAAEASVWGSAAMEYAAAFRPLHFARDPEAVDWRGYQHVTLVRPRFWPADLPLLIKQANPAAIIDRIPVDTPEALRLVLSVRVYYGWRYGPQTEFDWAQLWTPGVCLIGAHGRATGELEEADFQIVERAKLEAVKLTSHATRTTVRRLRQINPDMFILIRVFEAFEENGQPRQITPAQFVERTLPDLRRLLDEDPAVRYVEIHNEPNLRGEGLGGSWNDGREFGEWFLETMALLRQIYPDALYGFPGLSPGAGSAAAGRMNSQTFLEQAEFAAQQADWIGLHAYWVTEREMTDERLGFNFMDYRERFPEKLLFLTEFGNPFQPKPLVASQYARYYGVLRHITGLGAAFAYILSTPNPQESPLWAWRDESGNDAGIAPVVGRREFIREPNP